MIRPVFVRFWLVPNVSYRLPPGHLQEQNPNKGKSSSSCRLSHFTLGEGRENPDLVVLDRPRVLWVSARLRKPIINELNIHSVFAFRSPFLSLITMWPSLEPLFSVAAGI